MGMRDIFLFEGGRIFFCAIGGQKGKDEQRGLGGIFCVVQGGGRKNWRLKDI